MQYADLRDFIARLEAMGELKRVSAPVSPRLEMTEVCDRVLRAGRYWIPMWYKDKSLIAYWDVFSRPDKTPRYSTGAPSTWWWDAEKAKRIDYKG